MADNLPPIPPPSPNPAPRPTPPLKGTGLTGSLKNPTTRLPIRTGSGGKIVVMLSSVAKPPPASTQQMPGIILPNQPAASSPAPTVPTNPPPPLPPKQVTPAEVASPARPQLSTTTYVKLPPKTAAPGWTVTARPLPTPAPTVVPTPIAPPKVAELTNKKPSAQHIPPIKLNEPITAEAGGPVEESIFLQKPETGPTPVVAKSPVSPTSTAPLVKPESIAPAAEPVAKAPEIKLPVETKADAGEPVSLDLFEKAQTPEAKAAPASTPEAKDKPASLKAPPLMPPNLATPLPSTSGGSRPVRPPPLPPAVAKPLSVAPVPPANLEKSPEPLAEKAAAKEEPTAAALLAAELAAIPPVLDKPAPGKLPPLLETKSAESPAVTPPALPLLEKTPTIAAEKLPPPLETKPAEIPAATPPALPKLEKTPEPAVEKMPPPLVAKPEGFIASIPSLHVAPPLLEKSHEPVTEKLPPPLIKPVEVPIVDAPSVLHVAPPMLEKAPEPVTEKLPQPHLPPPIAEARKADAPPTVEKAPEPLSKPVQKAPAMIPSETAQKSTEPPKEKRSITSWLKKSPPVVLPSSSPPLPPVAEAKPALKPPTLPARSLLVPAPLSEPLVGAPKVEGAEKASEKSAIAPAVAATAPAAITAALAADQKKSKDKPASKIDSSAKPPGLPPKGRKEDLPPTRAERAKKRRLYSLVFFWAFLFPATVVLLFWASLQIGRDTRVEGQVIPPPGTVLSNEVWIVTDFRPLASGITEDLAAERTPLMQEIQERQDHVQRAQADVASREERIRLIQEEIDAHKAEIQGVVKQARDATQKVWDVDGAAIDNDYASRMSSLKRTIADRAKSMNLKYQPDETFDSPEVWANAYRLALYEVPAGVDGAKEHAWLSDQMKQWHDYQKSADDKKEALREKAAQIKLGPAPKITDLNAKIDDLQQRIDATEAEEVPLKAELQQAQADLVTAQSADVGLDDKYYKQLYSLPGESVIKRIDLKSNGRFTWLDDNVFLQGENQHSYYLFARATRADGRQYWSLGRITVEKNHVFPVMFEPAQFVSTKAILRPTLSPEEIEQ